MRKLVLMLVVLLALAACGGDTAGPSEEGRPDTESSAGDDTDIPQGAGDDSTTTTAGVLEENLDVEAPTSSTGTVTIGDTTYHLAIEADGTCDPDYFGGFRAFMSHVDADGAPLAGGMTISVSAEADGIIAGGLDGVLWSVATADDGSSIDSVDINGNRLTGTATFVSPDQQGEPVPGSFEVTCADQ